MKTVYDFTECGCPAAVTEVAPGGMVSVAEALSAAKAIRVEVGEEAEVIKVSDGAVCGMARPVVAVMEELEK